MIAEQLQAARAAHWRQKQNPVLTLDDAQDWLRQHPLCLYLPRQAQLPAPAPSFVEACMGSRSTTPGPAAIAQAHGLLTRLIASGSVVALNLLGAVGEQPDFLAHSDALPYVLSLRGDKDWKHAPQKSSGHKVSPLVLELWKVLEGSGVLTAAGARETLGRELTEAAVLRALCELWQGLRISPLYAEEGQATSWEMLRVRHREALATGGSTSQVTAISLLVSMYLQSVYAATSEEIEIFLSPVASRSRVREAVRGLSATRQIHPLSMDAQTYHFLEGGLPEFAEPALPAATTEPSRTAPGPCSRSFVPRGRPPRRGIDRGAPIPTPAGVLSPRPAAAPPAEPQRGVGRAPDARASPGSTAVAAGVSRRRVGPPPLGGKRGRRGREAAQAFRPDRQRAGKFSGGPRGRRDAHAASSAARILPRRTRGPAGRAKARRSRALAGRQAPRPRPRPRPAGGRGDAPFRPPQKTRDRSQPEQIVGPEIAGDSSRPSTWAVKEDPEQRGQPAPASPLGRGTGRSPCSPGSPFRPSRGRPAMPCRRTALLVRGEARSVARSGPGIDRSSGPAAPGAGRQLRSAAPWRLCRTGANSASAGGTETTAAPPAAGPALPSPDAKPPTRPWAKAGKTTGQAGHQLPRGQASQEKTGSMTTNELAPGGRHRRPRRRRQEHGRGPGCGPLRLAEPGEWRHVSRLRAEGDPDRQRPR